MTVLHLLKTGLRLPEEANPEKKLPIELLYRAYFSLVNDKRCRKVYSSCQVKFMIEKELAKRMQHRYGYQVVAASDISIEGNEGEGEEQLIE